MMIEKVCNIWDMYDEGAYVCITTNGFITRKGLSVCGRGVAAQAVKRYPFFKKALANGIFKNGNTVQMVIGRLVAFPVKPQAGICNWNKSNVVSHMRRQYRPYDMVPGWAMMADLNLIEWSLWQLRKLYILGMFDAVYLPKPGCGAGGVKWTQVKPYCEQNGDWLVVCDLK